MQTAPVDVSKIQVGDKITLGGEFEVIAVHTNPARPTVGVIIDGSERLIGMDIITAHHPKPKPLAVGDRVRKLVLDLGDDGNQRIYEITAIDSDGWVLMKDRGPSSRVTSSLAFLERVS